MKCNICNCEMELFDTLEKHENEVTSVYEQENVSFASNIYFYICPVCQHGQINNVLNSNYYDNYRLIDTGEEQAVKPYPMQLLEHYRGVVKKIENICSNKGIVMDIGCGAGVLLDMVSSFNMQIAIEPSKKLASEIKIKKNRRVINDYFNEYIDVEDESINAVLCTQVYEHIENIEAFSRLIYKKLASFGIAYIEIPNGTEIVRGAEYYNVYAEHINYFTCSSLVRLLEKCGFSILSAGQTFDGSLLCAYVIKEDLPEKIRFSENTKRQKEILLGIREKYETLGIYGCGNKAKNIVALMEENEADYLFDSNSMLWGKYLARSSKKILQPSKELIQQCDAIIVTALTYSQEIEKNLKEQFNFKGKVIDLLSIEK